MTDRISADPGRIKLTSETDGSSEFFTMEMADNPMEPGTPLQKRTLLSDTTEDFIFGDHQDRTVDEAFEELGSNRVRIYNGSGSNIFTLVPDTSHYVCDADYFSKYGATDFIVTKDYIIQYKDYQTANVYSRTSPGTLVKTITLPGSQGSTYNTCYPYGGCSTKLNNNIFFYRNEFTNGDYGSTSYGIANADTNTYSAGLDPSKSSIVYSDNQYVYAFVSESDFTSKVLRYLLSDMTYTTWKTFASSTYGSFYATVLGDGKSYHVTSTNKLVTIDYTTGNVTSVAISGSITWGSGRCGTYYDPDKGKMYFSTYSTSSSPYASYLYSVNVSSAVCTLIDTQTFTSSSNVKYIGEYVFHLNNDIGFFINHPYYSNHASQLVVINTSTDTIITRTDLSNRTLESTITIMGDAEKTYKRILPENYKYAPIPISGYFIKKTSETTYSLIRVYNIALKASRRQANTSTKTLIDENCYELIAFCSFSDIKFMPQYHYYTPNASMCATNYSLCRMNLDDLNHHIFFSIKGAYVGLEP